MALVGKLEDIRPAEIMVYLADSMKTGKLIFTTGRQEGMIVFRDGKIIYAASSSVRETFGSIALNLEIIRPFQLEEAVSLQHRSGEDRRLGDILVAMGAMRDDDVQRVLIHQVGQVVKEIFEWGTGFFRFRNMEIEALGEVEIGARDFVVGTPLDTRSVALDAAREQDESTRDTELALEDEDETEEPTEPTTLGEIMAAVAGPALTAEIIREIFVLAAATLTRGMLLAVREHSVQGLACYGLDDGVLPPAERVRQLSMPLDEYSFISSVVQERRVFRRQPDYVRANTTFFQALGGEWPDEGVAIPMILGDRVALVFYGDNKPKDLPVGSTDILETGLQAVCARLDAASQPAGE